MDNKIYRKDIVQLNENIKVKSLSVTIVLSLALILIMSLCLWLFTGTATEKSYIKGVIFPIGGTTDATLPQGGVVRSMFVQKGQAVRKGQQIALVSVDDSYSVISASVDGTIFSTKLDNEPFEAFEPIVSIVDPSNNSGAGLVLLAYSDLNNLKDLSVGQEAQIWPSNQKKDEIGYVRGNVSRVSHFPVARSEAASKVRISEYMSELIPENMSYYELEVIFRTSPNDPSKLDWTFDNMQHPDMKMGTLCDAIVIKNTYTIFQYLFLRAKTSVNKVKEWSE